MISFRKITEDNFDAIIAMKRPEGENFVASNAYSLAQAWLYREDGDVFPCAIYEEERCVGFLLLEEDMEEQQLILWRIMFPEEHTGKGYGTAAVALLLGLARECGKYKELVLDCHPGNAVARHVYEKLGFVPTGVVSHGSDELRVRF